MIAIGVTGLNCAGKGEFIRILVNLGYRSYSLSDMIRHELDKKGLEHSRENLVKYGNEMRHSRGPDILACLVLDSIAEDRTERVAVDSIRNLAELERLRTHQAFVLTEVRAPVEVRFKRAKDRGRGEDYRHIEDFLDTEKKEFSRDPAAQQLDAVIRHAEFSIDNKGSLEELETRTVKLVRRIEELLPGRQSP
ncbi:AAA family ATPase [Acidobacteriota bacterium]